MSLHSLKQQTVVDAQRATKTNGLPDVVVSPYRFNPLGAHVDHQRGSVLARTIDQYTLLPFWPTRDSNVIHLTTPPRWSISDASFKPGEINATENWVRYAQAAAAALHRYKPLKIGCTGYVTGTLVGAGLSSSASVVLAYLKAFSASNDINLSNTELVELSRQVENEFLGLNNGIQDQMSIVFGQANALSALDMDAVTATQFTDPANVDEVRWVVCYSGFSRELINSGFNTRVAECREAAVLLDKNAVMLGDLQRDRFDQDLDAALSGLPAMLARRARHFFTETSRVADGSRAWSNGNWQQFGALMNDSCHSSIHHYESGSQPLIDLHEIARSTSGVYGSRFSGGGYGGCLIMLTQSSMAEQAAASVLDTFRRQYPEQDKASTHIVRTEDGVRIETA